MFFLFLGRRSRSSRPQHSDDSTGIPPRAAHPPHQGNKAANRTRPERCRHLLSRENSANRDRTSEQDYEQGGVRARCITRHHLCLSPQWPAATCRICEATHPQLDRVWQSSSVWASFSRCGQGSSSVGSSRALFPIVQCPPAEWTIPYATERIPVEDHKLHHRPVLIHLKKSVPRQKPPCLHGAMWHSVIRDNRQARSGLRSIHESCILPRIDYSVHSQTTYTITKYPWRQSSQIQTVSLCHILTCGGTQSWIPPRSRSSHCTKERRYLELQRLMACRPGKPAWPCLVSSPPFSRMGCLESIASISRATFSSCFLSRSRLLPQNQV